MLPQSLFKKPFRELKNILFLVILYQYMTPSTKIMAKLVFNDHAKQFFNFPIRNTIRISFWKGETKPTSPCEITCKEDMILNFENKVHIQFLPDLLKRPVKVPDLFHIGTFPIMIGEVTVVELLATNGSL